MDSWVRDRSDAYYTCFWGEETLLEQTKSDKVSQFSILMPAFLFPPGDQRYRLLVVQLEPSVHIITAYVRFHQRVLACHVGLN